MSSCCLRGFLAPSYHPLKLPTPVQSNNIFISLFIGRKARFFYSFLCLSIISPPINKIPSSQYWLPFPNLFLLPGPMWHLLIPWGIPSEHPGSPGEPNGCQAGLQDGVDGKRAPKLSPGSLGGRGTPQSIQTLNCERMQLLRGDSCCHLRESQRNAKPSCSHRIFSVKTQLRQSQGRSLTSVQQGVLRDGEHVNPAPGCAPQLPPH